MDRLPTRDRLIETAMELFWERSFHATGVDELCARADARKGSFYHFFSSKTDLAVAAVAASWAAARTHVFDLVSQSGPPGLDRLRRLVQCFEEQQTRAVATHHVVLGSPFGGLAQETAHQDERLRRAVQVVFHEQCGVIEGWLDEAVVSGEIPSGSNAQRARNIVALLEGALLMAKVSDEIDVFRSIAVSIDRLTFG
ncbi:MAG: TetR/AcrR family transcriptional regulator [Acidobacteria bacterium]|nr:TetR/AcrR family transcriptional regulator [Acidobacteriota bacterium]